MMSEKTWRVISPKAVRYMFGVKHSILTGRNTIKGDCVPLKLVSMPPTSKKLTGHIGFGLCVRASVRPSVPSRTVHARVFEISYMDSSWKNI